MRSKSAVPGPWEREVADVCDRFDLWGKVGCGVHLSPDGARAVAELITKMARMIDVQEAGNYGVAQLAKLAGAGALFIAAIAFFAVLS